MLKKLRQTWIRFLILFDVRDPLKRTGKKFDLPEDLSELSPVEKRRLSICNLYVNQNHSVDEIARHYEMSRTDLVAVLIQESLIKDQRRGAATSIKGGRRSIDH